MILSISRRTDIPAFYGEWLANRVKAGQVMVRVPREPSIVRVVRLNRDEVSGIVFWTKNVGPFLPRLPLFKAWPYYFQYTVTPYGWVEESGVPSLAKRKEMLKRLSGMIGPQRIIWRYDPVILRKGRFDEAFHFRMFEELAKDFSGQVRKVVVTMLNSDYRLARANLSSLLRLGLIAPVPPARAANLLLGLKDIALSQSLEFEICLPPPGLRALSDLPLGRCIDAWLLEDIAGRHLGLRRSSNRRPGCGCAGSLDLGAYGTCVQGCIYCYATDDYMGAWHRRKTHDPSSPILGSVLRPNDRQVAVFRPKAATAKPFGGGVSPLPPEIDWSAWPIHLGSNSMNGISSIEIW